MINIASQKVTSNNNIGHITIELLKHEHLNQFYIYDSESGETRSTLSAQQALDEFNRYTVTALQEQLGDTTIDMYKAVNYCF